jgi:mRNA-degrading endonuclease RelE of RelBE toxin-antitoxin system
LILARTERFKREFTRLPVSLKNRVEKQLALLLHNPSHPSLRVEKMRGYPDIWEGRIAKEYRFTFQITGTLCLLRRIGTHDILKRP